MTAREIPLKVSTAPIVLHAPSVLKASEHSSFKEQVAKRFRLVPNFFVSAPDAPEIVEQIVALCSGGLSRQSNSNTLQGAAFCFPLAFLSGPLLHCAPLRISCGLWPLSGRPHGCNANH